MSRPVSVAIVSVFKHHSPLSGYKNVLRFTKPVKVFGIDYTKNNSRILLSHYFVHEFIARFKTIGTKFELLHILYGEDYFRFSHWLFPRKKIVVTFHQPPAILKQELSLGNYNGRIAGFTHALTRSRLRKMSAAIVMTQEQKKIAAEFIDPAKIHVIPLGVELNELNQLFKNSSASDRNTNQLITVGEWQRDWDLYLKIVAHSAQTHPNLKFILVNKNITAELSKKISNCPNVDFKSNISTKELNELYLGSLAMFLPIKSAAGNNALNEALALGCPIISNLQFPHLKMQEKFVFHFDDETGFIEQVTKLQNLKAGEKELVSAASNEAVQEYSWENVSAKLTEVYNSI